MPLHSSLTVPEVLDTIFEALFNEILNPDEDEWDSDHEARASLVALALTCRAFQEPALNQLWKGQLVFTPLIRCMPEDVWMHEYEWEGESGSDPDGTKKSLRFRRQPREADWERFDYYSRKVRQMGFRREYDLESSQEDEVDPKVFLTLASYRPARTYLPYLRSLHLGKWNSSVIPVIQAFFGPNMKHVSVTSTMFGRGDIQHHYLPPLYSSISRWSPKITTLTFEMLDFWREADPEFLDMLRQLKGLRSLTISSGYWQEQPREKLTKTIGDLEDLEEFCNPHIDSEVISLFTTKTGRFQSLRVFGSQVVDLDLIGPLLESMRCRLIQLRLMTLYNGPYRGPYSLDSIDFRPLANTSHPGHWTLTTFRFEIPLDAPFLGIVDGGQTMEDLLRPLLALPNIRSFTIALDSVVDLTDGWLKEAGRAWPSLEYINLQTESRRMPTIGFAGLLTLAELCPELCCKFERFMTLKLHGSPITSSEDVFAFLKNSFTISRLPYLVDNDKPGRIETGEARGPHDELWSKVKILLDLYSE
ncbi:hypothetical protein DXG01_010654 [Tephrocybe rancida]|nr:hypothetical protein DXG01_010654 [Tephrocybe rancida]